MIDLGEPTVNDLRATLEGVASDLRRLWSAEIERADFDLLSRLVEASHAVHRALLALGSGSLITPSVHQPTATR
jgi:hypothetical protein